MGLRVERGEERAELVRPVDRRDDEVEAQVGSGFGHRRRLPSPRRGLRPRVRRPGSPRRRADDRGGGRERARADGARPRARRRRRRLGRRDGRARPRGRRPPCPGRPQRRSPRPRRRAQRRARRRRGDLPSAHGRGRRRLAALAGDDARAPTRGRERRRRLGDDRPGRGRAPRHGPPDARRRARRAVGGPVLVAVLPLHGRRRQGGAGRARPALRPVVRRRARTTTSGRDCSASPAGTTCARRSSCIASTRRRRPRDGRRSNASANAGSRSDRSRLSFPSSTRRRQSSPGSPVRAFRYTMGPCERRRTPSDGSSRAFERRHGGDEARRAAAWSLARRTCVERRPCAARDAGAAARSDAPHRRAPAAAGTKRGALRAGRREVVAPGGRGRAGRRHLRPARAGAVSDGDARPCRGSPRARADRDLRGEQRPAPGLGDGHATPRGRPRRLARPRRVPHPPPRLPCLVRRVRRARGFGSGGRRRLGLEHVRLAGGGRLVQATPRSVRAPRRVERARRPRGLAARGQGSGRPDDGAKRRACLRRRDARPGVDARARRRSRSHLDLRRHDRPRVVRVGGRPAARATRRAAGRGGPRRRKTSRCSPSRDSRRRKATTR